MNYFLPFKALMSSASFASDDFIYILCALPRVQASCPSTCSWSATRQRTSTSLTTPVSTAPDSATAPTTRVSSCTRRPGHAGGVPLTSPVKLHSRWAPATRLFSNVLITIRSHLHPAEPAQKREPKERSQTVLSFKINKCLSYLVVRVGDVQLCGLTVVFLSGHRSLLWNLFEKNLLF